MAHRREALADLEGVVLEVGAGSGPNFPLYPSGVERVIALEPEPYLRARATEAASAGSVPIEVMAGTAQRIPMPDASVDAVVFMLVLCSVPDQRAVLEEARRALRPGGELRVYEHVVARHPVGRRLQRAADAIFWPRCFGGCHTARDTGAAIQAAGFDTSGLRRLGPPRGPGAPLPHILGRASLGRSER